MKSFEFMYATSWYKYENSDIYKQNRFGDYVKLCPVLPDLERKLDSFAQDQRCTIMEAVLYGYYQGKLAGADAKVKEIKNVLCIN
jgi:hypothetical protein